MTIVITFRDGKIESFNDVTGILLDNGFLDIGLKEKIMRPPTKHPIGEVTLQMDEIHKVQIVND